MYTNIGAHLRQVRESRLGQWQGPLDVPPRSIVLCAGLASERDELLSELLALALRENGTDARSIALPFPFEAPDPGKVELVSTVLIPCPLNETIAPWRQAVQALRLHVPHALIAAVRLQADEAALDQNAISSEVDMQLHSFEECLAFANAAHG